MPENWTNRIYLPTCKNSKEHTYKNSHPDIEFLANYSVEADSESHKHDLIVNQLKIYFRYSVTRLFPTGSLRDHFC